MNSNLKRLGLMSASAAIALVGAATHALPLPPKACVQATNPGLAYGNPSFFDVLVSDAPGLNGTRDGWCLQGDRGIDDFKYTVEVFDGSSIAAQALVAAPSNIDLAAWVLNQGFVGLPSGAGGNFTYGDVQRAIWSLIDSTAQVAGLGEFSWGRVNEILSLALVNGEGFVPGCGQQALVFLKPVATVCDLDLSGDSIAQNMVITVPAACPPPPDPIVSSLGDKVWLDKDLNGVQSASDEPFPGVKVELMSCDGKILDTKYTDSAGNYLFRDIVPANYMVRFTPPEGYALVAPDQGANDLDSDANPASGLTQCIVLPPNTTDLSWDAGLYKTAPTGGSGCQECQGGVTELTLKYTGTSAQAVKVMQQDASGAWVEIYSATVPSNDIFTITGVLSDETLGSSIKLYVGASLDAEMATDCTRPIGPGLVAGRFEVVGGFSALGGELCAPPPPERCVGTGTIGYWKNHPEAWPVPTITLGGKTYTRDQAISIMNSSGGGDKRDDLFRQLVAAKLNVLNGTEDGCVRAVIAAADTWWATYRLCKVTASSAAWTSGGGGQLMTTLDNYNNGLLCAPHRDSGTCSGGGSPPPPPPCIGTGTIGYWKNHPEAWPVDSITVGGKKYSKDVALAKMINSDFGDKRDDFFRQLVAAKLNILIGTDSGCIASSIAQADTWWATYRLSRVTASSTAWQSGGGGQLMTTLDDYNNGRLCAPHRDTCN